MSVRPEVDVAHVVDEIRGEVRRKQAAGEYPAELLARLRTELSVGDEDEPIEALSHIDIYRQPVNRRPVVGRLIVLGKKVMRRSLAWYIQPIALDQNRFNAAIVRELRALERRVERTEPPLRRAAGMPPLESGLDDGGVALTRARVDLALGAAQSAPPGPAVVLGPLRADLVAALRREGLHLVEPSGDTAPRRADDPIDSLEGAERESLSLVIVPGLVALLTPADLLQLVPLAASRLAVGGRIVIDSPGCAPPHAAGSPAEVDPAMARWVEAATIRRLCEAAGLFVDEEVTLDTGAERGWFAVVALRGS